jgi:uncharacterized protein (TIGR02246 family)
MKRFLVISVVILGVLLIPRFPQARTASNEAQIRHALEQWTKAFEARDIRGLMSVYAPGDEFTAYNVTPPLRYEGRDAYEKALQGFFEQFDKPLQVEMRDVKIVAGNDVAFVHGLERVSGTFKDGQKMAGWLRLTQCYRRIDGHWLAVHDHVSVPVDMQTGKGALDLEP